MKTVFLLAVALLLFAGVPGQEADVSLATAPPLLRAQRITVALADGSRIMSAPVFGQVAAYHNIPFAEKPLGEKRFMDPLPNKPWAGVRDGSRFHANCMQPPFDPPSASANISEDCLYLSIMRRCRRRFNKKVDTRVDSRRRLYRRGRQRGEAQRHIFG